MDKQELKKLQDVADRLAERKPDPKAYERFKRKPYTVGGVAIESRRKQCEK